MRLPLLLSTLLLLGARPPVPANAELPEPTADRSAGLELHSLTSNGSTRWYRVYQPPGLDPGTPAPVVLAFHGGGGNAREFAASSGLAATADQYGFLLVFPEGSGLLGGWPLFTLQTWNAGNCCGWAQQHQVDDLRFVDDLITELGTRWNLDPDRVYATGHSNGAMLCYRLAAELPGRLAAIGPNAGALGVATAPSQPIPVIAFHGKLDQNVPFGGGVGSGVSGTDYASQRQSLAPFVAVNGAVLPDPLVPTEVRGQALRFEAPAPTTGADIHYWFLRDGGHSWPGHGATLPPNEPTNFDIDINEELWAFFSAH